MEVPSLTHDHLKHCQERPTQVVKVRDAEIHIWFFVEGLSFEIYSVIFLYVSAPFVAWAGKTAKVISRARPLDSLIDYPELKLLVWVLLGSAGIIDEATKLLETQGWEKNERKNGKNSEIRILRKWLNEALNLLF